MQNLILGLSVILSLLAFKSNNHGVFKNEKNISAEIPICTQNGEESVASFVHTVFFWMKDDFSIEDASYFEAELEKLGKTPSINSYRWGKPAGTPRDVVDNSYTYAWIVDFKGTSEQDAYQVDPIHLAFIEKCKGFWERVQVYDTILE